MTPKELWQRLYRYERLRRADECVNPNAGMWLREAMIMRAALHFKHWWEER